MKTYIFHRIAETKLSGNFNHPDHVKAAIDSGATITWDGIYEDALPYILMCPPERTILFFCKKHVGETNSFDEGEPNGVYLPIRDLRFLEGRGYKLGYHSYSHRGLTNLDYWDLVKEIEKPKFFNIEVFAYPYGVCDERVIRHIKEQEYTQAFCAGEHGDDSQYQKRREYWPW